MSTPDENSTPHLDAAKRWHDVSEAAGASSKATDLDERIRAIVREEIARATPTQPEIAAILSRVFRAAQPRVNGQPVFGSIAPMLHLYDDARRLLGVLYDAAQGQSARLVSHMQLETACDLSAERFCAAQAELIRRDYAKASADRLMLTSSGCAAHEDMSLSPEQKVERDALHRRVLRAVRDVVGPSGTAVESFVTAPVAHATSLPASEVSVLFLRLRHRGLLEQTQPGLLRLTSAGNVACDL